MQQDRAVHHVSRAFARVAPFALGFAVVLGSGAARADLAAGFMGKLTVDAEYVTGANGATDIAFSGDGRAIVTTKGGRIAIRRANGTLASVNYPFGGTLDTGSEKGLLGVVADPNVAQNNAFYFYVSNGPTDDKHRVYRAVLTATDTLTVDATPIIAASRGNGPGLMGPNNHDGGGLVIYQNQLYIGVGDTGANATPPTNRFSNCLNHANGKILRVNLDGSIPGDNPLPAGMMVTACSSTGGAWTTAAPDRRIYAWGFRNPWRFWIDSQTNLMWIGDVGETTREEISVGTGNQHYGYPFVEGDRTWGNVDGRNCTTQTPSKPCTPSVYAFDTAPRGAVTGGLIPSGCGWSTVFNNTTQYLFADSVKNFIRALPVNAARTGLTNTTAVDFATYTNAGPVSFRMGPDESLYIVMNGAGAVYRFTPLGCGMPGGGGGAGGASGAGGSAVSAGRGGAAGASTGGTGGVAGGAGASGSAGTAVGGAGGTSGAGGAVSGGGTTSVAGNGTAGSATPAGGAQGASGAGTVPGGGALASAGAAATAGAGSGDDKGGCGCRTVGRGSAGIGMLALGGALFIAGRWRRRRR